jgi:hypothetical protein
MKMKEHILLEKTFRYPAPEIDPVPQSCTYNTKKGYWIKNDTAEAMMLSKDPHRPQSKKADRETGEDQKGE